MRGGAAAWQRNGDRGTVGALRGLLPLLRAAFRRARFLVRLDGGSATPEVLDCLDVEPRLDYVVAMGRGTVLQRHCRVRPVDGTGAEQGQWRDRTRSRSLMRTSESRDANEPHEPIGFGMCDAGVKRDARISSPAWIQPATAIPPSGRRR